MGIESVVLPSAVVDGVVEGRGAVLGSRGRAPCAVEAGEGPVGERERRRRESLDIKMNEVKISKHKQNDKNFRNY